MQAILGKKIDQSQAYLLDGTRIPVTNIEVKDNPVVMVKTADKNGYVAIQLGYDTRKHATKAQIGHAKKGADLEHAPYFLREVRVLGDEELPKPGDKIAVSAVLEAGDIIDITGTAKGKGFAGVVKRHHFRGGPRTHGQSDRERAPGSIGQTTTPGRVYRGKRMAGKMGNQKVTIKNLEVVDVLADAIVVNGVIPGVKGAYIFIKKVGKNTKFVPLLKEKETKETDDKKEPKVDVAEVQEAEKKGEK